MGGGGGGSITFEVKGKITNDFFNKNILPELLCSSLCVLCDFLVNLKQSVFGEFHFQPLLSTENLICSGCIECSRYISPFFKTTIIN